MNTILELHSYMVQNNKFCIRTSVQRKEKEVPAIK